MHNEPMLTMGDQGDGADETGKARRAKLFALLRGRWHWAILLGLLLGLGGAYAGFMSEPDLYRAASYIEIKPEVEIGADERLQLAEQYNTYITSQMRRMQEEEVVDVAMDTNDWRDAYAKRLPDYSPIVTARQFVSAMQIDSPRRHSNAIQVAFVDRDPQTAQAGLNALLSAYDRIIDDEMKRDDSLNLESFDAILQGHRRELENLKVELARIIPEEDIPTLNSRLTAKLNALSVRERQLETLNLDLKPFMNADGEPTPQLIDELSEADPQMLQLIAVRDAIADQLRNAIEVQQYGESHPTVMALNRSLAVAERDILELENQWASGDGVELTLPADIQAAVSQREGLIDAIAQLNAEIDDLSRKKDAVDQINLDITTLRARIADTQSRRDDYVSTTTVQEISRKTLVKIGPKAGTPSKPYNVNKRRQMAAAGGVAGLMMGFGLIMLVGAMDRRLRHVNDATAGMPHANVLGILPTLPASMKEPEQAEAAAHCVHHIRTLLQIGGKGRVFSITSPTAGSGKSSLTSALGLSFATSQTKTLVIDCDLVGAGLSRRMGTVVHQPLDVIIRDNDLLDEDRLDRAMTIAAAEGAALDMVLLREGIMDEGEIERAVRLQRDTSLGVLQACAPGRLRSCVAAADVPDLYILPVGNARPSDAGKLSPTAIRSLIQQAREDFDIVLIDTGPVLGSLEASIAAAESDATVLIVSRGDQKSLVQRSLSQLESVRASVAGLVFNHALDNDLAHTSYASIVSQDRRPDRETRRRRLPDASQSARYGPLGSAVASYADEDQAAAANNGSADD